MLIIIRKRKRIKFVDDVKLFKCYVGSGENFFQDPALTGSGSGPGTRPIYNFIKF